MSALSMRERIAAARGDYAASKSQGIRPYKFKNGITKFRILPSADPDKDFWREFGQIYLKSFDGKNLVVIGDKYLTYGQEDPIRDMVFAAMKAADEDARDHFKEMLGGPRVVFNALILNDPENQKPTEPVLVEISLKSMDEIWSQMQIYFDVNPEHDITSLSGGHVFQCEKTGSTKTDTRYSFSATPMPAPLNAALLEKANDLDGWIKGLFEAKEQKALQLLASLGVAVGDATSVAGVLAKPQAAAGALAAPAGVSPAAVTEVTEDDELAATLAALDASATSTTTATVAAKPAAAPVEDAVYEPVAETPVVQQAAPAKPTPAAAPASSEEQDIAAILASLD